MSASADNNMKNHYTSEELGEIFVQHANWRKSCGSKGKRARIQNARLRNLDLQYSHLRGAALQGTDFQGSYLRYTDFRDADLQGADFRGVHLEGCLFQGADLRNAQLDINIRDCYSFKGAKFTSDALPWLILHPDWMTWKESVQIEGV